MLFLLLETLSLIMVFNYNSFQRAKFLNSANRITGDIYSMHQSVIGYFTLNRTNRDLAEENARLRMFLYNHPVHSEGFDPNEPNALTNNPAFRFIPARIINNSVNRPFNYITLNKGGRHGIKPDQGILSAGRIVGVVAQVSESYSMGLSLLNQRWSVSAKLKETGFFGSLVWQGNDYRYGNLTEIPLYVNIARGDTVITSGFSSIFPEGLLIGTVHDFSRPDGENYYTITVRLAVDFKAVSHVEIIDNLNKDELLKLENLLEDDKRTN